jgi:hypothetical protein
MGKSFMDLRRNKSVKIDNNNTSYVISQTLRTFAEKFIS